MNNWIQNIKGQLSDLATEVLQEATEEGQVSTSSELQVEKKRSTESERLYLAEKAQNEELQRKLQEFEDQLYSTNIENDAIKEKFMGMVSDRDHRISQLNKEIERLKFHRQEEKGGFRSIDLDETSSSRAGKSGIETNSEIAKLKEKHEQEISAIISVNAANVQQMREEYEKRIQQLESWNVDMEKQSFDQNEPKGDDEEYSKLLKNFDTLRLENEGKLAELSSIRAELDKKSQQISQVEVRNCELEASVTRMGEIEKQMAAKEETALAQENEIKMLKTLNAELMASYNETVAQMEEQKRNGSPSEAVRDLSAKIASLKSMLNETETRYELCKMEQNETSGRLENLLSEFADLRSSMQAAKATADGNEQELMTEVHSLRDMLGRAKDDREKLVGDFRDSMRAINEELAQLRECNGRLVEENTGLGASLAEFETLRNNLNAVNNELSAFHERFAQMQSDHMEEIETLKTERQQLEQKLRDLQEIAAEQKQQHGAVVVSEMDLNSRAEMAQQIELLRAELREREEELVRVKNEKLLMTTIPPEGEFKRPSSDTDESAASNNDWERMGKEEIEVEGVSSSASETKESQQSHEGATTTACSTMEEKKRGDGGKCAGTQSEEDEQKSQMRQKIAELEGTVHRLQKRIAELEEELTRGEAEVKNAIGQERQRLEEQLLHKEDEMACLREEMASREDLFQKQAAEMQQEQDSEMSKLAEAMEGAQLQLKNMADSNDQLATTNAEMLAENDQLKAQMGPMAAESAQLREQLRAEIDAKDRAIDAAEGLIKLLERRNAELEERMDEIGRKLAESTGSEQEDKQQFALLQAENDQLRAQMGPMAAESAQLREQLRAEIDARSEAIHAAEEQIKLLEGQLGSKSTESEQEKEQFALVQAENAELCELVQKKHTECQEYYAKLQQFAATCEKMEQQLKGEAESREKMEQEIGRKNERIAKLDSELTRLRDHLMTVEEMSSKEAMAAEERETELRARIRHLQEKCTSDESSIAQSMERYGNELADAKRRIASLVNENGQMRSTLEERETTLGETKKALGNMQHVLKDLAEDQQAEKRQFEAELRALREEVKKESMALAELREENSKMEEEREESRTHLDSLQTQLVAKNALVEELENQLEEARTSGAGEAGGGKFFGSAAASSSFKIDDFTLRQLFLSFFTAEKSKQPDIAVVMSKILGYSAEEQAQIQKALHSSSSGASWLFGLGGGGGRDHQSQLSLTEQFIRFLEQESVTNAQPMLTLPRDDSGTGAGFLVGESLSSPATHHSSSSSSDLKSILDS